ncbi:MAG: aldehyde dehydrogenase [Pelatocladus maniniholoensis HA4357-MV3]|jgi:aldehyde dehydrogenase (NAD+)|uniref:Aldehyde dehydrogenase n=1 Tax=Pelatocladus maniniholoensis HA4357-MV3 TaxID=1117104 RepID=A0A9E3H4M1_9NOST|nr:aldehyde dehydrogenase [Pelatocladus maniniholoensis HA4357-MV3]
MLTQSSVKISNSLEQQKHFFRTGKTKDIDFRIVQLQKLKQAINDNQPNIFKALKADLNKSGFDAYFEFIGIIREIDYALKHIKDWVKPKKVATPYHQFPASTHIYSEPFGVTLIIGPWNYPFNLVMTPLIGAIASGNCAVLKPSEISAQSSGVIAEIISKTFEPSFIKVIEGSAEVSQELLSEKFDHIFFTGGTEVGKIVMSSAAKYLIPVTLELGGKSPCIVDENTHLEYTAKRIVWGKFINAGQTCTAPDYLLVHKRIKASLLNKIEKYIKEFYSDVPSKSTNYSRIINQKHFLRLANLLNDGTIIVGGETDLQDLYIAPTVIDRVSWQDKIMQEEIFGPILPVIEYTNIDEAIAIINENPKPLALYFFSKNKQHQTKVLQSTASGGVCINDTVMHLTIPTLPFGGVGESGMGRYHGKAGFENFSYQRSVLKKSFIFDLKWRYYPTTQGVKKH